MPHNPYLGNEVVITAMVYTYVRMQARSLFPVAAASEVWEQLRQPLRKTLSPSAVRALMLLLTFFPHKTASMKSDTNWHEIATEAVDIWLSCKLNSFWNRLWLCFLSRLAKWDTHVRPSPYAKHHTDVLRSVWYLSQYHEQPLCFFFLPTCLYPDYTQQ